MDILHIAGAITKIAKGQLIAKLFGLFMNKLFWILHNYLFEIWSTGIEFTDQHIC